MESPLFNSELVGRVTPCAPQFGNAQTARRGLTRPTFRFMESPLGLAAVHWDCEPVWTNACSICYTHSPGSFVGSWKASFVFSHALGPWTPRESVAQALQPAGSRDILVPFFSFGRLESRPNRQTGMSALHPDGTIAGETPAAP